MKNKDDILEMIRLMPDDIEAFNTKVGEHDEIVFTIFLKPKTEEFYEEYFDKPKTLREKAKSYKRRTGYENASPEEREVMVDEFIASLESLKLGYPKGDEKDVG